ncbi:MAG TPA: phage tail protein [Burkholderiaceae bacterium]
MAATLILPAFRFEVTLLRSADIVAGAQSPPGAPDEPPATGGTPLVPGDWSGAFQECGGLEIEMDVQEYQEGGRNDGTIRRVGRAKFAPLVLKRGMFHGSEASAAAAPELWQWLQDIVNGVRPVRRYDGVVRVMSADGHVRATWTFDRGLPSKIRGPALDGKSGEVAIEELTIQHEGLRLMPPESA